MRRNELTLINGNGFIHFATDKPNWKMAYEEFCDVCRAGGIRIDNATPMRAILRRAEDGRIVSIMPSNVQLQRRGGRGFHSGSIL